jgi:hypothetical protein
MTIEQFLWTVPFVALGIALAGLLIVYLTKPRKRSGPQDSQRS